MFSKRRDPENGGIWWAPLVDPTAGLRARREALAAGWQEVVYGVHTATRFVRRMLRRRVR